MKTLMKILVMFFITLQTAKSQQTLTLYGKELINIDSTSSVYDVTTKLDRYQQYYTIENATNDSTFYISCITSYLDGTREDKDEIGVLRKFYDKELESNVSIINVYDKSYNNVKKIVLIKETKKFLLFVDLYVNNKTGKKNYRIMIIGNYILWGD